MRHASGATRASGLLLAGACLALQGCAGLHMHRPEQAVLAKEAKATWDEKVDLLSLVATVRANMAKQRESDLAAVRESLLLERDWVLFTAAPHDTAGRLRLAQLPATRPGTACQPLPGANALKQSYIERRSCELLAPDTTQLAAVALALGNPDRTAQRVELAERQRLDLRELGWKDIPLCHELATLPAIPPAVLAGMQDKAFAQESFSDLKKDCAKLEGKPLPRAYTAAQRELRRLQADEDRLKLAAADVQKEIQRIAATLKALGPQAAIGDTRRKIEEGTTQLRERIAKLGSFAEKVGAEEQLSEERISALTTLLAAAEGTPLTVEALRAQDPGMRRAVVVAHTLPSLGDLKDAYAVYKAPPRSSLLMAQRQAMLDKERLAAEREILLRKRELAERRMAAIAEEAGLLAKAAREAQCGGCNDPESRVKLAYNYLSRSIVGPRADQEAAQWEAVYLDLELGARNDEYVLKSWNNLIATPLALIDGYHAGGIKAEAVGDLLVKLGGLGILGIAVDRSK